MNILSTIAWNLKKDWSKGLICDVSLEDEKKQKSFQYSVNYQRL